MSYAAARAAGAASRRSIVFKSPEATAEESLLQSAAADVARVYSGSRNTTAETRDNNYNKTATVEHR